MLPNPSEPTHTYLTPQKTNHEGNIQEWKDYLLTVQSKATYYKTCQDDTIIKSPFRNEVDFNGDKCDWFRKFPKLLFGANSLNRDGKFDQYLKRFIDSVLGGDCVRSIPGKVKILINDVNVDKEESDLLEAYLYAHYSEEMVNGVILLVKMDHQILDAVEMHLCDMFNANLVYCQDDVDRQYWRSRLSLSTAEIIGKAFELPIDFDFYVHMEDDIGFRSDWPQEYIKLYNKAETYQEANGLTKPFVVKFDYHKVGSAEPFLHGEVNSQLAGMFGVFIPRNLMQKLYMYLYRWYFLKPADFLLGSFLDDYGHKIYYHRIVGFLTHYGIKSTRGKLKSPVQCQRKPGACSNL